MTGKDIKFQAPVEMQIAHELARRYDGAMILPNKPGKNSHQDFKLFRPLGVEVKCDYKAKESRNLFFETFNSYRKEPSGLSSTTAWMWAHYVPGDASAWFYCPKKMLAHCKASGWRFVERVGDNNSDGYIGPIAEVSSLPFVSKIAILI